MILKEMNKKLTLQLLVFFSLRRIQAELAVLPQDLTIAVGLLDYLLIKISLC